MSQPLRILHLLDTEQFAGTEQHILTLISALDEIGVVNLIGCRKDSALHDRAIAQGISVVPLFDRHFSMYASIAATRGIRLASRKHAIDVLHAHNGRTELLAAIVRLLTDVTVVSTQHFIGPRHLSYSGIRRIVSKAMHSWVGRKVSATIAVSAAVQQAALNRKYYTQEKISVILSGIVPASTVTSEVIQKVRAELGCAPDQLLIVTAARLELEKRIDCLISAIPEIVAHYPSARFAIVGKGKLHDALTKQVSEAQVEKNVIFTGFREDAQDLIAACDIFVLPSPNEPFGLVLLEAMAAGKPVIAAAQGGPLEIVEDGVTGLLFDPNNANSLADKIAILLGEEELRTSMGRQGALRFARSFTARRMAQETVDIYERAVGSRRDRSKSL